MQRSTCGPGTPSRCRIWTLASTPPGPRWPRLNRKKNLRTQINRPQPKGTNRVISNQPDLSLLWAIPLAPGTMPCSALVQARILCCQQDARETCFAEVWSQSCAMLLLLQSKPLVDLDANLHSIRPMVLTNRLRLTLSPMLTLTLTLTREFSITLRLTLSFMLPFNTGHTCCRLVSHVPSSS